MRHLLLMSSSQAGDTGYLNHGLTWLKEHFSNTPNVLFIPFAGVTIKPDAYTQRVQEAFSKAHLKAQGIHEFNCMKSALKSAEAIAVGGGNTYQLLNLLYEFGLYDLLKQKIATGTPYAGWSAGSNIVGPSIRTTNDMPIVQPRSFTALNQVSFQINPHYTNAMPAGHRGETRQDRIQEFQTLYPHQAVIGIPEGTALSIQNNKMRLLGDKDALVFADQQIRTLKAGADCSHWL